MTVYYASQAQLNQLRQLSLVISVLGVSNTRLNVR